MNNKKNKTPIKRFSVSLPFDQACQLVELAAQQKRSAASQIAFWITEGLKRVAFDAKKEKFYET
jgi:hypothetical protein